MTALATGTAYSTSRARINTGKAGAALNSAKIQAVYYDLATRTWKLAQATTAVLSGRDGVGVCLTDAASGSDIYVMRKGLLTLSGATMTVGETYVVGAAAAGDIAPIGDLASTNLVTILGVAKSATVLQLDPIVSVTAHA